MPQGVEHYHAQVISRQGIRVKITLMPQGVEHSNSGGGDVQQRDVKIPLMPQGVEHSRNVPPGCHLLREDSIDAARR